MTCYGYMEEKEALNCYSAKQGDDIRQAEQFSN